MAHVGDPVVGNGIRCLVLLDADAASAKVVDGGADVRNAPRQLGLGVRGADRAEGHRQLRSAAAAEDDPIALVLAHDLESEHVAVEGPAGVEVPRKQDREHGMIAEHLQVLGSGRRSLD